MSLFNHAYIMRECTDKSNTFQAGLSFISVFCERQAIRSVNRDKNEEKVRSYPLLRALLILQPGDILDPVALCIILTGFFYLEGNNLIQ